MKKTAKKLYFAVILSILFAFPASKAQAETPSHVPLISTTFDMTGFPQWARDMRRWEIVAFGSFPFTMLFTSFAMNTFRWYSYAGMGFSGEDLRYSPFPWVPGRHPMTSRQRELTFIYAAGLSAAIAFADLFIVQSRRRQERRRIENLPPGTAIITRSPHPQADYESENDSAGNPGAALP